MKQRIIGNTPIDTCNETINQFMKTHGIDYFEDEHALQKAVEYVKALGFGFDIGDCEAYIFGKALEPTNIPSIANTTKEATFGALEIFAKLKINNHI